MNTLSCFNIILIGSLAQLVGGTFGMGYGMTSSTLLIAAGFFPVLVSASIHTAEVFNSLASGCSHLLMGNVRRDIFWPLTFFGVTGGVIGAIGLVSLPMLMVRPVIALIFLLLGVVLLVKFIKNKKQLLKEKVVARKITPLGLVAGFVDAFSGGGWGPICTPVLMINGSEPRKVIGSVKLAEFFVTTIITITFFVLIGWQNIPWDIVVILVCVGVVMAPLSAWFSKKVSPRFLGILIGVMIITLNIGVLLSMLGGD